METTTSELLLTGYSDTTNRVSVRISSLARRDRLRRASIALLGAWSIAAVMAFVPVAHFVLVPAFLLFGVVMFLRRLRTVRTASAALGTCPDCGVEQEFDLSVRRWALPYWVACGSCQRRLTLRASD